MSIERRRSKRVHKRNKMLMIEFAIQFVIIVILALLIIGNQNTMLMMQTDTNNQIMDVRQELDKQSEIEGDSLGEFTITHYCSCEKCCGKTATGTQATEGRTIAVTKNSKIHMGDTVTIDGIEYTAEDLMAGAGDKIDIYASDHQTAINRGKIVRGVYQ